MECPVVIHHHDGRFSKHGHSQEDTNRERIGGSRLRSRTSVREAGGVRWDHPVSQQERDFASRSTQMFLQGVFFPFRMNIQRSYSSVTWELYGDF